MGVASCLRRSLGLSVRLAAGKGSESWELEEVAQSRSLAVAETKRVALESIGRLASHKVKG